MTRAHAGGGGALLLALAAAGAVLLGRGFWRLAALGVVAWAWAGRGRAAGGGFDVERVRSADRAQMAGHPGTGAGPGAVEARDAPGAEPAREEESREEEFEAQREAAREENRAIEERQHAPRGPEGVP